MEPVEIIKYKGHIIKIQYDDDPESPRAWDNLGTMVCFHNRSRLGDEHNFSSPEDFVYDLASEYFNEDMIENDHDNLCTEDFINKYLDKLERHTIILPLYLYEHSGMTMNTTGFSCQWDSGQVGWIFVKRSAIREEWGKLRISPKLEKQAIDLLKGEVEAFDNFLTGKVYGFEIYKDGDEEDCLDSCWGFYGDTDYPIREAKGMIDGY